MKFGTHVILDTEKNFQEHGTFYAKLMRGPKIGIVGEN